MELEQICRILNQVFDLEKKIKMADIKGFDRNLDRIRQEFGVGGYHILDPIGELYDERRTDYEATLMGAKSSGYKIVETIKPVIYQSSGESKILVQKGVVLAEAN